MAMKLKKKTVIGISWIALSKYVNQFVLMVVKIVLARLLIPEQFGLFAVASIAVNSIKAMSNIGLNYALIHRRERIQEAANTALLLVFILAIGKYILVYLIAGFVANIFNQPSAEFLIKILALNIFISDIGIVPSALLDKELKFKEKCYSTLLATITGGIFSIGLAIVLPLEEKIWSLIGGCLTGSLVGSISVWRYCNLKISPKFDGKVALELVNYGKYCLGLSILMYLYNNLDNFVVGKILGMAALGYFTFAYGITTKIGMNITSIFGTVALPVYAKLQDDIQKLKQGYLRVLSYSSLLSIPTMCGIFILAPEIIRTVFGEKWLPAILPLQILSIFCLIRSIDTTTGELYAAIGKPKYNQNLGLLNLTCMAITIYPLVLNYGTAGAALSITIARVITMCINFLLCAKVLKTNIWQFLKVVITPCLASTIMTLCLYIGKNSLQKIGLFHLAILTLSGITIYSIVLYLANKELFIEIKKLLMIGLQRERFVI